MATSNLGITELTTNQTGKTVTINNGFEKGDQATQGLLAVSFTANARTLTADEFTNAFMFVAGALSGTGTLTIPLSKRFFAVDNSGGGHALTVNGSTGATVSVADGSIALLYCDGTDCFTLGGASGGGGVGTVTSITFSAPLTGGTITGSGTVGLGAVVGASTDANVTATGSNQSGAYLISKALTICGTVAANTGVRLPAWAANAFHVVVNRGANVLSVYPDSGSAIEGLGTNNAGGVSSPGVSWFAADTSGVWRAF